MRKEIAEKLISVPAGEYKLLKEIYRTAKRQNLLFRIDEAEQNLKNGQVKKVGTEDFIKTI